jgi:hypothetical protein
MLSSVRGLENRYFVNALFQIDTARKAGQKQISETRGNG